MGTDKIKLAKEGIEAFSAGDWERFKAPLSADATYEELATQRKVQGPDQIVEADLLPGRGHAQPASFVTDGIDTGLQQPRGQTSRILDQAFRRHQHRGATLVHGACATMAAHGSDSMRIIS